MIPPKPPSRADKVSLWRYARLFREDILSAQPARLYRAWMAEFKTPFFRSYMVNDSELLSLVLKDRPDDFPKSNRIGEGLRPLLGNSVFLTNGDTWKRQRRIIDPAFEGGRLRDTYTAIHAAGAAATKRLATLKDQDIEIGLPKMCSPNFATINAASPSSILLRLCLYHVGCRAFFGVKPSKLPVISVR